MAGRHKEIDGGVPTRFPLGLVAGGVALALLAAAGGWAFLATTRDPCKEVRLNVVASPDIATAVNGVAERFNRAEKERKRDCAQVTVSAQESAQVTAGLAAGATVSAGPAPHIWIPDSSIWLDQALSDKAPISVVGEPVSLASSPVVIALTKPVAASLGDTEQLGWARLIEELRTRQQMQIGFPNPTRHTTGLATLLAAGQIIQASPQARVLQVALTRTLSDSQANEISDLTAKLPKQADEATIAASIAGLPATEQSVWQYNSAEPAVPLVAAYPTEGTLLLDYPFVRTLAAEDQRRAQAADRFLAALQQRTARNQFLSRGFRAPDGTAGKSVNASAGLNPQRPRTSPKPPAPVVAKALGSWSAIRQPGRMLVLIDTSGSMAQIVPGINKSRIDVTVTAAQQGLGLLSDRTEVGVWEFAAQLVGRNQDYRLLVPPGPLSEPVGDVTRRAALANVLTRIRADKKNTGLYDSILAVYRTARTGYKPGRINSVLVYTDGKNNDPGGGATLAQLIAELRKLQDPQRPIPVFMLLFGQDADAASARQIARATSGTVYNVNNPGEITKMFLDAVGQRTCRPNC